MAQGGPGLSPQPTSSLVGMEYTVKYCWCVLGGTLFHLLMLYPQFS